MVWWISIYTIMTENKCVFVSNTQTSPFPQNIADEGTFHDESEKQRNHNYVFIEINYIKYILKLHSIFGILFKCRNDIYYCILSRLLKY